MTALASVGLAHSHPFLGFALVFVLVLGPTGTLIASLRWSERRDARRNGRRP